MMIGSLFPPFRFKKIGFSKPDHLSRGKNSPPKKNDNKRSTPLVIGLSLYLTFCDFLSSRTLATCGRLLTVEMGLKNPIWWQKNPTHVQYHSNIFDTISSARTVHVAKLILVLA